MLTYTQGQLSLASLRGRLIEYQLWLGKGGNVTSAGWQVTLCDPIWHVSSRSGVATLRTAIHLLLTCYLHKLDICYMVYTVYVGEFKTLRAAGDSPPLVADGWSRRQERGKLWLVGRDPASRLSSAVAALSSESSNSGSCSARTALLPPGTRASIVEISTERHGSCESKRFTAKTRAKLLLSLTLHIIYYPGAVLPLCDDITMPC